MIRKVYHRKFNLILVTLSLIIALILSELILRNWFPQRTLPQLKKQQLACYQSSQYLPYELRPFCQGEYLSDGIKSHVRINSIGLRGGEIGENNGQRILLVGDSFTFGYGVEEDQNISSRLEEELRVEVINGGVWGFGPDAEYLMAEKLVGKLKPDYLVVFLFPANDLRDLAETNWVMDKDNNLVRVQNDKFVDKEGFIRRDAASRRYYISVVNESHLAALVADGIENVVWRIKEWFLLQRGVNLSRGEGSKISGFEDGGDIECLYQDRCQGLWLTAREKLRLIMERFLDLSQNNSLPVLLVMIPSEDQLRGDFPTKTIFHNFAESQDHLVVDLTDGFKLSGYSIEELYLSDGHWTLLGNRLVAETIAEKLAVSFQRK